MGWKRVRHPGGRSRLYAYRNPGGEWSVWLEPEGLLIDSFHRGIGPHAHDPTDPERRAVLGEVSMERAERGIADHLHRNGRIRFQQLIEELKHHGD